MKESDQIKRVVLYDIQGLYGGTAVYVSDTGITFIQIVRPEDGKDGLQEKRYIIKLKPGELEKLQKVIGENNFLKIKIKNRLGVPDEAHPIIEVIMKSGKSKKVWKWFNDVQPDFDAIYQYLGKIAEKVERYQLIHQGSFDYNWVPVGFTRPSIEE